MHRTGGADSTTSKPTLSGSLANNTYHTNGPPGTIYDAYWANAVQEELCSVVEAFGTLDTTGDVHTQVRDELYGAYGLKSHLSDTGTAATNTQRVLVASASSQASGAASAVIASAGGIAAGARSAVIATFEGQAVSGGTNVALIASAANAEANLSVDGDQATIIACTGGSGEAQSVGSAAEACAMIACADGPNVLDNAGGTIASVIMASKGAQIDTATACAIIACGYSPADTTADRPVINGGADFSAFIGCDGDATMTGNNCIALASSFGATGVTISDSDAVVIYSGTTEKIKLTASTGQVKCDALRVDESLAGTGGGTPALASGVPTGAGTTQADWLPISISGTTYYIPVWT